MEALLQRHLRDQILWDKERISWAMENHLTQHLENPLVRFCTKKIRMKINLFKSIQVKKKRK